MPQPLARSTVRTGYTCARARARACEYVRACIRTRTLLKLELGVCSIGELEDKGQNNAASMVSSVSRKQVYNAASTVS